MKGTRPLDNNEIRRVSTAFTGTFATRNHGLFMLGVNYATARQACESMAVDSQPYRITFCLFDMLQ